MRTERAKEPVGQRREWTRVAVQADTLAALESGTIASRLLDLAFERQWQLVSLGRFSGMHPSDPPSYALVTEPSSHPEVGELLRLGVPTVRIAMGQPEPDPRLPTVTEDWEATGCLAAEHFAQRDFKHVAFLGADPWGGYRAAYEGLASRAKELGLECHLSRMGVEKYQAQGSDKHELWALWQNHFTSWMLTLPKPVGLLVESDASADRNRQWLTDAGLRVPQDVAVLGMGNQHFVCESAPVPISSIAFDPDHFAQAAVQMLAQLMAGEDLDRHTERVKPLGIITRKSTDVLAATDPHVIEALRYMRDNIAEDLSVDQIVSHVGVNRRTLERAFGRELGRGINREFQRRRLEKARELLAQTNLRIFNISQALGFSTHNYFCRVFRSAYGVSPGQYRRQHAVNH